MLDDARHGDPTNANRSNECVVNIDVDYHEALYFLDGRRKVHAFRNSLRQVMGSEAGRIDAITSGEGRRFAGSN